jgi:hypothetical protein
MKRYNSFTPAMYNEILKNGLRIAKERGITDKKGVNDCINEAIILAGYSTSYVAKVMRKLCSE